GLIAVPRAMVWSRRRAGGRELPRAMQVCYGPSLGFRAARTPLPASFGGTGRGPFWALRAKRAARLGPWARGPELPFGAWRAAGRTSPRGGEARPRGAACGCGLRVLALGLLHFGLQRLQAAMEQLPHQRRLGGRL